MCLGPYGPFSGAETVVDVQGETMGKYNPGILCPNGLIHHVSGARSQKGDGNTPLFWDTYSQRPPLFVVHIKRSIIWFTNKLRIGSFHPIHLGPMTLVWSKYYGVSETARRGGSSQCFRACDTCILRNYSTLTFGI